MNSIQELLDKRLPFAGLAAWSLRRKDRTLTGRSYVRWLPATRAEEVLARLALAADGLRHHYGQPVRLCYRFEHLSCHLALRSDGACLAVIVQNQPQNADAAELTLLQEFVEMSDGSG